MTDTTTWPEVIQTLGFLAFMGFFCWLLFKDGK